MKKGSRLINEFSWSFSRHSTFLECEKKYWYTYYGSWEGWPKTPFDSRERVDPLASYLYTMKQIQNLSAYVGSCVHEAIEEELKKRLHAVKKDSIPLENLISDAITHFRQGIQDTKKGTWKVSPKKHANIFEYYFRQDKASDPLTEELVADAEKKISLCLTNWHTSSILKMAFDDRARWLSVEELAHFLLESFKIIVVIDFAMKWKNSQSDAVILFDWKTGQESDKNEEQLYSYALFAHRMWGIPYDRIILSPFYLASNKYFKIGFQQETPLDLARIQKVEDSIVSSCKTMTSKLETLTPTADTPPPDPRLFPYTVDRAKCPRCPFQNICTAAKYEPCTTQELGTLVQNSLAIS